MLVIEEAKTGALPPRIVSKRERKVLCSKDERISISLIWFFLAHFAV